MPSIFEAGCFTDVQTAAPHNPFDVAGVGTLDDIIGCLVNNCRIHIVLSFRGWHSCAFIFGGVQWRIAAKDNKKEFNVFGIFIVALIVFTGVNFVEISQGYSVDYFADIIIGNVPLFIFTATTGTAVIILCSKFVTGCKNRFVKNCLMKCGRNSLSIYGVNNK